MRLNDGEGDVDVAGEATGAVSERPSRMEISGTSRTRGITFTQTCKEDSTMPRGDGTGPSGMGPITGRGAGYCSGNETPGFVNSFLGRAFGGAFGRGGGRGRRTMFFATGFPGWRRSAGVTPPYGYAEPYGAPDPEVEKQGLKNQASILQTTLDEVKRRLADLEKDGK